MRTSLILLVAESFLCFQHLSMMEIPFWLACTWFPWTARRWSCCYSGCLTLNAPHSPAGPDLWNCQSFYGFACSTYTIDIRYWTKIKSLNSKAAQVFWQNCSIARFNCAKFKAKCIKKQSLIPSKATLTYLLPTAELIFEDLVIIPAEAWESTLPKHVEK